MNSQGENDIVDGKHGTLEGMRAACRRDRFNLRAGEEGN